MDPHARADACQRIRLVQLVYMLDRLLARWRPGMAIASKMRHSDDEKAPMTEIDFAQLGTYERYKLMASLIVPRPIALVTTLGADGTVNAAPFSMFNMMGEDPPVVMLSVNKLQDTAQKDTATNILRDKEFVVHIADEAMAAAMHRCGDRLAPHESELDHTGLTATPSQSVRPPRIVQAPVAFECVLHETLETPSRYVFIGRVQWLAVRDGLVDTEKWRVRLQEFFPVGRFGASFYINCRERFAIEAGEGLAAAQSGVGSTAIDEM